LTSIDSSGEGVNHSLQIMAQHPVTTALHSLKNTTNSPTVYCSMPDHAFTQKMKKDGER